RGDTWHRWSGGGGASAGDSGCRRTPTWRGSRARWRTGCSPSPSAAPNVRTIESPELHAQIGTITRLCKQSDKDAFTCVGLFTVYALPS
ncbi:unnamed protein product, partial [Musa textilis]